jgi:argininosuccinate lyase
LRVLQGLIRTLKLNEDKIKAHLKDESLYATDLVYYLVDKKVAFKEAHTIVGRLVKYSLENDIEIKAMPDSLLKEFSPRFVKNEIVRLFDPLVSVRSKKSVKRNK